MTTKPINASRGGTRDVNCTCNVLHVSRSSQFNTSDVLNQIVAAQGLLATGQSLSPDVNKAYGQQNGVSWLGEVSSDVEACTWAKDIDGTVGTIMVQLKPRTQYLETILPGDLLFVFMSDAGDYDPSTRFAGTLVSVVVVDRVAARTQVQNMTNVDNIMVSARDLAVVLLESSTVFDQAFTQIENAMFTGDFIGQLFGTKKQNALSPLENVLILLLLLYDAQHTGSNLADLQWKLTADANEASLSQLISLLDVTTYIQNPLPFYAVAEPPGIVQAGNIWSLLESYSNPLLNEFFIDVRDGSPQERQLRTFQSALAMSTFYAGNPVDVGNQNTTVQVVLNSSLFRPNVTQSTGGTTVPGVPDGTSVVALVMRQRPYDDDTFNNLPVTNVDSTEVEVFEMARSSHDVLNWFRIRFPNLDVKLQEVVRGIRMVAQSIAKFGFRRMDSETRYMFASSAAATTFAQGSTKTDFGDIFDHYVALLSQWYSQNEYWYAGQMTMRFKPSVRIGTRLRYNKNGVLYDFYVTGVQHSFSKDPGASRSTFTLIRGRNVSTPSIPLVPTSDFQHDGFNVNQGTQ